MKRSDKLERLDTGDYTEEEYRDCLAKLGQVGTRLGGDRASYQAFDALGEPPASILDVGCGGGEFSYKLARRYPLAQVTGMDISEEAIAIANQRTLPNLSFTTQYPSEPVEVVTATLVCHHMKDDELIEFLKKAASLATRAVIINDLHRSYLALSSYAIVAPLLFRNSLITEDGLTSIRRSFKRGDWERYLSAAGLENWSISWKWPFRWIVQITPSLEGESQDSQRRSDSPSSELVHS
jgi:2-polyprenyl-3-methyl-5-hydroxy-6-metoxy-1,4-benzoquinol methylase